MHRKTVPVVLYACMICKICFSQHSQLSTLWAVNTKVVCLTVKKIQ